jgi:hypothetical protein
VSDECGGVAVVEEEVEALFWECGVEWEVGGVGLEGSEECDEEVSGSLEADGECVVMLCALLDEEVSELVGFCVEL